jgi:hypothetical protein
MPGTHTISARSLGDSTLPPSQSPTHIVTVTKGYSAMAISGDTTVRAGNTHTVIASVYTSSGTVNPTGAVQIHRNGVLLGTATLINHTANFSFTLGSGTHDLVASYPGDSNFVSCSKNFSLTVLPASGLVIEARGEGDSIVLRAALPSGTAAMSMYRSISGANSWSLVSGWSPTWTYDGNSPARGVLYDYQLAATVNGVPQSSNIDSAMLFTDDPVVAGTTLIKRQHFDELRIAVNALRSKAGLAPFTFDETYALPLIRASHITSMRTAITEARNALGMFAFSFTDPSLTGMTIKAAHIRELRDAAR